MREEVDDFTALIRGELGERNDGDGLMGRSGHLHPGKDQSASIRIGINGVRLETQHLGRADSCKSEATEDCQKGIHAFQIMDKVVDMPRHHKSII